MWHASCISCLFLPGFWVSLQKVFGLGLLLLCWPALLAEDHRLIIEYQSDDRAGIIFDDVMTEDLKDVACFLHKCIRNFSLRQINAAAYFWQFRLERLEKLLVWIPQYYFKSKKEKQTFMEILLTAGVDRPDDMLFVTSNLLQAFAAKASGCTDFLALGVGVLLVLLLAFAFGCSLVEIMLF
ncbi:hypothetical protein OROMI_014396 [Orobanche minor]